MANSVAGVCYLKIGDEQFSLRGDVSIMGFSTIKEPIINLDGTVQVQTMPTVPKCSATFTKTDNTRPSFRVLETLGVGASANLTVATEAGTHTFGDVFVQGEPTYDPEDGTISVDFVAAGGHTESARATGGV